MVIVKDKYQSISLDEALKARDRAIDQVESNVEQDWFNEATKVIFDLCLLRTFFNTDDVWSSLSEKKIEPPHEPRAMGAVMTRARRWRWIRPTGRYEIGVRPEAHGRPIMTWQSVNNDPKWPSEK